MQSNSLACLRLELMLHSRPLEDIRILKSRVIKPEEQADEA